jgi:Leucine-rich repeat (LRR) protein
MFSCCSNQISSLTTHDGGGDWSSMKDTLTNVFLGDNDLTELPKLRTGNGNGGNNNNKHHNWNRNRNRGGTEPGNGSGASLAECRMLTWLNLDGNKVHYTGCFISVIILVPEPCKLSSVCLHGLTSTVIRYIIQDV